MNYLDVLDLVPDSFPVKPKSYTELYIKALEGLNKIKLSRYSAMYFGSMMIGDPTFFEFKDTDDFTQKYLSTCLCVVNTVYEKLNNDVDKLVSTSLSMLYSMLANYANIRNVKSETIDKLIAENDNYKLNDEVKKDFGGVE